MRLRSQKRGLYAMAISFSLSVCLLVCSFVACEICEAIRYVAAPGGEQGGGGLIVLFYDTIR